MPEWQFKQWQHYAARRMLPQRRLELYLAQIALWSAKAAGVANPSLTDFLFDPPDGADEVDAEGEVSPEVAASFFGFTPRPKSKE